MYPEVNLFEYQIKTEKKVLRALLEIESYFIPKNQTEVLPSEWSENLRKFVTNVYSNSSQYGDMISKFVGKCRIEIENNKKFDDKRKEECIKMGSSLYGSAIWSVESANWILNQLEESITWIGKKQPVSKSLESNQKKILGVLKSFPRISVSMLSDYSGMSIDSTRDMLFELIGDGLVSGRFDPTSDEFISAQAAAASKEIKSESISLARCMYCGKSLERALISGEEITCPSCGMVNVG